MDSVDYYNTDIDFVDRKCNMKMEEIFYNDKVCIRLFFHWLIKLGRNFLKPVETLHIARSRELRYKWSLKNFFYTIPMQCYIYFAKHINTFLIKFEIKHFQKYLIFYVVMLKGTDGTKR